jgi:hypothetical protein
MRKQFSLLIAMVLMLVLISVPAFADLTVPLWAGQTHVIGTVTVSNDASNLYVEYNIADTIPYNLIQVHVYAALGTGAGNLPKKLSPGSFPYNENAGGGKSYIVDIPLSRIRGAGAGASLIVLAHADVRHLEVASAGPCPPLPTNVQARAASGLPGKLGDTTNNYIDIELSQPIAGKYLFDGWCVESDTLITPYAWMAAQLVCSYSAAASGLVDNPGNLPLVNYILNRLNDPDFTYDWQSIQKAIWALIDVPETTEPGDGIRGAIGGDPQPILDDAYANGVNFVPGIGDVCGVIVATQDAYGQPGQYTIIPVPVPTVPVDDTAWGIQYPFPPSVPKWGGFIIYVVQ